MTWCSIEMKRKISRRRLSFGALWWRLSVLRKESCNTHLQSLFDFGGSHGALLALLLVLEGQQSLLFVPLPFQAGLFFRFLLLFQKFLRRPIRLFKMSMKKKKSQILSRKNKQTKKKMSRFKRLTCICCSCWWASCCCWAWYL